MDLISEHMSAILPNDQRKRPCKKDTHHVPDNTLSLKQRHQFIGHGIYIFKSKMHLKELTLIAASGIAAYAAFRIFQSSGVSWRFVSATPCRSSFSTKLMYF